MTTKGKWNCVLLLALMLPAITSCRFLSSSDVMDAQEIVRSPGEGEVDIGVLETLAQRLLIEAGGQEPVSMDRFLERMKALPGGAAFFANYTVSYETIANQGASKDWPRVIMTNDRGSLTLTFTHDSNLNGNQIEMIQVDPISHERIMFSVTFPLTPQRIPEFRLSNPDACLGCHQTSRLVHHLWGRYPNWPGIIGSRDDFVASVKGRYEFNLPGCDTMMTSAKDDYGNNVLDAQGNPVKTPTYIDASDATLVEYNALVRLHELIRTKAERYRHLDLPEQELAVNPLYPYSNAVKAHFKYRPNFRMGGLWHRHQINHVMHLAETSGKEPLIHDLFLYGFMECQEVALPETKAKLFTTLGIDPSTEESGEFWMNAGLRQIDLSLSALSINEDIAKRASKTGYFPGSDSSDRLMSRLILERDAARGAEARYPHDTYNWNTGDQCNVVRGINDYKYLDKFGHRAEAKSPEDLKRLCDALADSIIGRQ